MCVIEFVFCIFYLVFVFVLSIGPLVSILAGTGTAGFVDGASTVSQFRYPIGITRDSVGVTYVADENNHAIRMISTSGNNCEKTICNG